MECIFNEIAHDPRHFSAVGKEAEVFFRLDAEIEFGILNLVVVFAHGLFDELGGI